MSPETAERRDIAVAAARAAGDLLVEYREQGVEVERKGRIDLVSEADRAAEALVREHLTSALPNDMIVGEEGEVLAEDVVAGHPRWYVDPLDGTTNYLHGASRWAVSLGWANPSGAIEVGVVYAPALGELFYAERGSGTWLEMVGDGAASNATRLHVTDPARLDEAVIASGFPYDLEHGPTNLPEWASVTRRARSVRCLGAAALDLCDVARGNVDGFWEQRLGRWDTAAGILIAAEAGAVVTDLQGRAVVCAAPDVVAAGASLHGHLLVALREASGEAGDP